MEFSELTAISPIDGRYRNKVEKLSEYFSEYALIRFRVLVEIEYLIALGNLSLPQMEKVEPGKLNTLRDLYGNFSLEDAKHIKEIERTTNHDVKAVEYFIREKIDGMGLGAIREFIHFGLTSQDINNTAVPYSIKKALKEVVIPQLEELEKILHRLSVDWKNIPMLTRTHGQPASPSTLGKEIRVFRERLGIQLWSLKEIGIGAKFGGATGNFNAHKVAFPDVNWIEFANEFVADRLGLERQQTTTQVEHYDNLSALFDNLARINTLLIDFCRDIWLYVSIGYFKQKILKNEVGSSAMPHKVNPIDFENAEGNFGIANAFFGHLSAKLPISRLQRDLTDSTVLRNIGIPVAHSMVGVAAIQKGIGKLMVDEDRIHRDLEDNWLVVAEAIQNVLRREGYENPYEALKNLTRTNESIGKKEIHEFIDSLKIKPEIRDELKQISPFNYLGYSAEDFPG